MEWNTDDRINYTYKLLAKIQTLAREIRDPTIFHLADTALRVLSASPEFLSANEARILKDAE